MFPEPNLAKSDKLPKAHFILERPAPLYRYSFIREDLIIQDVRSQ